MYVVIITVPLQRDLQLWCEAKCIVERGNPAEKILDVAGRTSGPDCARGAQTGRFAGRSDTSSDLDGAQGCIARTLPGSDHSWLNL